MKYAKFLLLAGLMVLSIMAVLPTAAAPAATEEVPRTTISWVCESAHNYVNNFDYTWTKTVSGATKLKVTFEKIDLEANYDHLYIMDGANTVIYDIKSDYLSGCVTDWITGDTVKLRLKSDSSVTAWGFKTTTIEYEGSSTPPPSSYVLTNGVASTGNLATSSSTEIWNLAVGADAISMHVVLTCGSNDFDFFASNTDSTPDHSSKVFEGYSSGGEDVTQANPAAGTWYFMVNAYSGTGAYTLTVTVEYETAPPPPPPPPPPEDNVLENGVASTSSLSATGASEMWEIQVNSGAIKMESILTCGSADFDLYGKLGAEPTTSVYDWRGYTSGGEEVTFNNPGAGTWYVMVRSYSGGSSYSLTVTVTYQTADTTAPSVSITSPSNGATVGDTVTVQVSATDNVGVVGRAISIDGGAYTTSLSWDTTAVADGSHTIRARAWDAAGNYGYSSTITVTVENEVAPPPSNVLTSGTTATGSLAAQGATYTYTMAVEANCVSMYAVLTCGSADFDLYGRFGAAPTTSTYDWRGYTSGGEEVTTSNPGAGTWYIMVRSYSGTGAYGLTVTLDYDQTPPPPPPPPPTGDKFALLVGISNYKAINDLSYCDEDVNDWYNYLVNALGYDPANIIILGDGTSSYAKTPAGKATEANYKYYLNWLADQSGEISFITSGHGAGSGTGSSYLCAWDCGSGESGEDGDFYDTEIKAIMQTAVADKIFIFIDHCYSGGIGPELMAMSNSAKVYCTTTCTEDGYGYDDPASQNGAWTAEFLQDTLISHFGSSSSTTMEAAFDYASANYAHSGGDAAMEFDGNTGSTFTI